MKLSKEDKRELYRLMKIANFITDPKDQEKLDAQMDGRGNVIVGGMSYDEAMEKLSDE